MESPADVDSNSIVCLPCSAPVSPRKSTDDHAREDDPQKETIADSPVAPQCSHYSKLCDQYEFFGCCEATKTHSLTADCHRCHQETTGCTMFPPKVRSVRCTACNTRQPPAEKCANVHCQTTFAASYCPLCCVWTEKEIMHCDKCGLCRQGNADALFHCDTCNACFFRDNEARKRGQPAHVCMAKQLRHATCPFCLEDIFTSQLRCDILRCGHAVHSPCMKRYIQHWESQMANRQITGDVLGWRPPTCPTCRKSVFIQETLEKIWSAVRNAIAITPTDSASLPEISPGEMIPFGDSHPAEYTFRVTKIHSAVFPSPISSSTCEGMMTPTHDPEHLASHVQSVSYHQTQLEKSKIVIVCTDCENLSRTLFHPFGLECRVCFGFNTQEK